MGDDCGCCGEGPIKFTRALVGLERDDDDEKKYVTLKLVDLGVSMSTIRDNLILNLMLFEVDRFDSDGKTYRGGSRGAFEWMMDLREWDVVILLNPRVLKPYQMWIASTTTTNEQQCSCAFIYICIFNPCSWSSERSGNVCSEEEGWKGVWCM